MNTDLILFDDSMHEIGVLAADADFEVGTSEALNNFEIQTLPLSARGFYIEGTEYGGIFEYLHESSVSTYQTRKGWTWRGLLTQSIVIPPSGSDYRIVSGEANSVIRSLLSDVLGGFFSVPETDSGCEISSYQFGLYTNLLDGLMDMLAGYGYRLNIRAEKVAASAPIAVYVEAVPVKMIEGTFNSDSPVEIEMTVDKMGINHLVCMGSGELQNRMRVDLYIDGAGGVSETQYYTGFDERTAYYDYASAESRDDLVKYGTERLLELASSNTVGIHASETETLEVGDLVRAQHNKTVVRLPIVRKILKLERGMFRQEYRVKGEQ